jgi:hypothetical protein
MHVFLKDTSSVHEAAFGDGVPGTHVSAQSSANSIILLKVAKSREMTSPSMAVTATILRDRR